MHEERMHDGDHMGENGAAVHEGEAMGGTQVPSVQYLADDVTPAFREQIAVVLQAYQEMKNALVASNLEEAGAAASAMLVALDEVDADEAKGQADTYWEMRSQPLRAAAQRIADAGDIEVARRHFATLTQPLKEALVAFDAVDATLYVQYCPMAFDDEGASWISAEQAIRNPYFGDRMLKCGSVQETLPGQ